MTARASAGRCAGLLRAAVEHADDVRARQGAEAALEAEPLRKLGVDEAGPDHLDGDRAAVAFVDGAIDGAHAPAAQEILQEVPPTEAATEQRVRGRRRRHRATLAVRHARRRG